MIIRDEQAGDLAGVRAVVTAAFGRSGEAELVDRLRRDGDLVLSLVAAENDEVVGSVLFSPMTAPFRALGMGPVAVRPERQRAGIGSRLIRTGLERARQTGWQAVFVLGYPNYYRRFGFDPALASGFTCRYSGPNFMALGLTASLPATTGAVAYAPAFASLD